VAFKSERMNHFYSERTLNWSKVTVKTFIMLQNIPFRIN